MNAGVDWTSVFVPAVPLMELIIRASFVYLILFAVLRFIARRQAGHLGPAALLVVVLIADASQNALGETSSVTEASILVATIIAWERFVDWLAWTYPTLRPLLTAPPLKLIENGKIMGESLAKERITDEELASLLREHGIERVEHVKVAYLEGDGRLGVIQHTDSGVE
jgi:uncharacterized membrane protein YcaP (DUF421 family)